MKTRFSVLNGDVTEATSDLLLLKHASAFYGVDRAVSSLLEKAGICAVSDLAVTLDKSIVVETKGVIAPARVMFLGTPGLYEFGYPEMQRFARQAVEILTNENTPVRRLTTTIHGVGYGLDAEESLQRLVEGFTEGLRSVHRCEIQEIVFVESDRRRAHLLTSALAEISSNASHSTTEIEAGELNNVPADPQSKQREQAPPVSNGTSAIGGTEKRHVFVAMPFSEDFEDVYEYGIYGPVRACGLICEKTSETAYTGDILHRIKERIETADYVVAEMSGARPNVYLEVGYAWGKGVPVIFLAKHGEPLHFDVSRHRCIYYKSIRQLAKDLEKLLRGLLAPS